MSFSRPRRAEWMWRRALPKSSESMHSMIQFGRRGTRNWRFLCVCAAALLALLFGVAEARAQGTQLNPVAQIIGQDVSVQGPSAPGADNERGGASIMIGNGSVVIRAFRSGADGPAVRRHRGHLRAGEIHDVAIERCSDASGGTWAHACASASERYATVVCTGQFVATPLEITGARGTLPWGWIRTIRCACWQPAARINSSINLRAKS